MKLIVGLGNPGEKYESTRHNIGFMVVEELARKWTKGEVKWEEAKKAHSLILKKYPTEDACAHGIGNFNEGLILAKPQAYMNKSGMAVASLVNFYKVGKEDLWVVHDDLDIPLGKFKIARGKGTAGHHGVASIVETLGSVDFVRFRLGIGREHITNPEKFVLEPFLPQESDEVRHMIKQTVKAIEVALTDGIEKAMSQFNR